MYMRIKTALIAFFLVVVSPAISFTQVKNGLNFELGGETKKVSD